MLTTSERMKSVKAANKEVALLQQQKHMGAHRFALG